jgi:hypothetical protein
MLIGLPAHKSLDGEQDALVRQALCGILVRAEFELASCPR